MKFCNCLLLLFLLFFAGCAGGKLPLHQQAAPLPSGSICRVAVLPFINESKSVAADTVVAKVFAARLQEAGDYLVVQDGDIYKTYRQLQILPGIKPDTEQFRIIADRVGAQLLITGTVLEMREDPGEHRSIDPVLQMEVEIRDGRSGEVLWSTFHHRQGSYYKTAMHFGSIYTVTGLAKRMAEEVITLWFKKGLSRCNV